IVENALLHGIDPKRNAGVIRIRVAAADGRLILEVADNGAGIEPYKLRRMNEAAPADSGRTGVGTGNIRRRLQLQYGDHARFRIESRHGYWTKVTIDLPLGVF
ncbi:MAG: sensor histidine kinase, partial [Paenibacillaceae bacterium]|nr:sensor histidine kinase [Paenibacillaceae bacterium]